MIGIVIPVHNEERHLPRCLDAVQAACAHRGLDGEATKIIVVLDTCHDNSGQIARMRGVETVSVNVRNVGLARAAGADYLLACGTRWLAFTDADSEVGENWLVAQLALQADAVCGTVSVMEWSGHSTQVRRDYERSYRDCDGHRHIHGANLGVSALAYARAGGFSGLPLSEDVALVHALAASGARIAWSAAPRVVTSARGDFKIAGGFGSYLNGLAHTRHDAATDVTHESHEGAGVLAAPGG